MKKVILLLIFVSLALTASAQVNLDFTINIDDKIYFPNEKVKVDVIVVNRDVSFAAKNAVLTLTIADREYSFKLGDISAGQNFSKEITLPEFPPGTHTIKGVLSYTGIFDETFTIETYNSFEVRFPEVERYPRNVNVIGFNLPDKLIAGKTYDVSVVVKNEGIIGGNMIIEVASLEEFVDEETFLGPGESKTINLKINFKNTEVSLIEARVYALINGIRYLLVYSGKKAYLEPERVAKLLVDRLELIDESDNQINQNDEVKLKIFLKNTGNYPASSVKGKLKSSSDEIEISQADADYILIQNGQNVAPTNPYIIKTKDIQPGQYILTLDVNYEDSEKHTVSFDVPLSTVAGRDVCSKDMDCADNEVCRKGKCEAVSCECGFIKDKQCIKYECCSDSECGGLATCNKDIYKCVQKSGCINLIKSGPSKDKFDFLFIGADFSNNEELKEEVLKLLDLYGDSGYNGFFSIEPFKSNKDKFNAWMVNAQNYPTLKENSDCSNFCSEIVGSPKKYESVCPEKDVTIVLFKNKKFRSCAGGNIQWDSLACQDPEDRGRLILHETGHTFGLADEYTEPPLGSRPWGPNCAENIQNAKKLWEDLVGERGVGYYSAIQSSEIIYTKDGGCSYVPTNIRPTENSIMRGHWWYLKADYGPVNERHLLTKLSEYK